MKKLIAAGAACLALGACVEPGQVPIAVSEFNGDSVSIQIPYYAIYSTEEDKAKVKANMQAEAERICRKGSRKQAEYVSQRTVSDQFIERLYLCLN